MTPQIASVHTSQATKLYPREAQQHLVMYLKATGYELIYMSSFDTEKCL